MMNGANSKTAILSRPRWTFRIKLTVLAVVLAIVPVVIVGFIAIEVNQTALSEANRELLYSVLDRITNQVDEEIRRDHEELSVAAATLMDEEYSLDTRLSVLKAIVGGGRLPAIGVYDQEGQWIDTVSPVGIEAPSAMDKSISQEFRNEADRVPFALGSIQHAAQSENDYVPILVKSQGANTKWYLVSHFHFSRVQNDLEAVGHQRLGKGHSLLLVDSTLRVLSDSQIEHIGTTVSAAQIQILRGVDPRAMVDKGLLIFGDSSHGDRKMLGAIRSLQNASWAVVAEIPRSVAFHSIEKMRWILWLVVGIASILALLIGVYLARKISAPLQALVGFAGDLASRRFDKRIEVHTGDELSVLGRALSNAAIELEISDKRIADEIRIRSDLGRYLSAPLVDRIVDQKQDMHLGGDRCEITVLFADVVGFTPLAETHSAEEIVALLNELFTILTEIVFRHDGTVDKFIGDSVMAFWGAPNPDEDHAELALRAAEDMQRWLDIGNEGWKKKYGIEIQLAIGVNTGEAVVGNFGSKDRMEYTSIGDCVNVAARLETMARPGQILLTRATMEAAGKGFDYHSLGSRNVIGRRAALELFEVVL